MAGRRKEMVVLVLDVGPRMHQHLEGAARAAGDYVMSKMLYKPAHELAIVLFGATDTRNHAHDETAAAGDDSQYRHIFEAHRLGVPDAEYIRTLHSLAPGEGQSDFFEALGVAAGLLARVEARTVDKKIVLLSNLCSPVAEDTDEEMVSALAARMQEQGIRLDVVELDAPEDEQYQGDKQQNLNHLAAINMQVSHSERVFRSAIELAGAFVAHEVAISGFNYSLEIGSKLAIQVKLAAKTKQEKFPSAGREAGGDAGDGGVAAEAGIERSREWYHVDAEAFGGDEVPQEDVMPAYLYGAHLIPFSPDDANDFKLPTEKSLKLVGFVDPSGGGIARHQYMGEAHLLLADKGSKASQATLVALVAAMQRRGELAVLRYVYRTGSAPKLFVASPVAGTAAAPPHLLLNVLPYMEDCRDYRFASFQKDKWQPTTAQLAAAEELVAAMSLGEGPLEQLVPDGTPNPHIHRLYYELGRKVVDPEAQLLDKDALWQAVLEPRLDSMPSAADALDQVKTLFPMGQEAREHRKRSAAGKVSTEKPLDDFNKLVDEDEDIEGALDGLASAITNIVFGSMGDSKFTLSCQLVERMREVCVDRNLPGSFNSLLEALYKRCNEAEPHKQGFWQQLNRRHVKPISKDEAIDSEFGSEAEADQWFREHWRDSSALPPPSQQATQLMSQRGSQFGTQYIGTQYNNSQF
ncbi:hypothetical protein ABPG75_011005 [Micractinium tetrahymenae]